MPIYSVMPIYRVVIYLCFFLSGAAALLYEIVWQRMLTLVFGLSTMSVAAVLSAFLGGLAIGARLTGPIADRTKRPVRLYALIEICIAAIGLASLFFIPPVMKIFALVYAMIEPGWLVSNLIRFILSCIAIGIPSILIGATVPLMTRIAARHAGSTAIGFGGCYAVNVAGSVCGAMLGGFLLMPNLGIEGSLFCAVAGNCIIFLMAYWLPNGAEQAAPVNTPSSTSQDPISIAVQPGQAAAMAGYHFPPSLACTLALLTGALALAYEIAWIRILAIFTLNSVYVFTMVVSVYLTALAIGSALVWMLVRFRWFDRLSMLAITQLLQALLVPVLLYYAPEASKLDVTSQFTTPAEILLIEYKLVALVVFVPTLLIGFTLPLLVSLAEQRVDQSGHLVGRIYAWNTAGSILGSALTGVLLIPLLGIRGCLLLLAAGNLTVVAITAILKSDSRAWFRGLTPASAALFTIMLAFLPATTRYFVPLKTRTQTESIVYYAEGPSATVHVAEYRDHNGENSHRALYVDSKSVAGTYDDIVTDQKMLAHLPLLLHPDPKRTLTVGFGTGGTSYSMLQYKIRVECVEIEPRVPEAYDVFKSENHGQVGPNHNSIHFRLILDDARAWLTVAPYRYDVIVTDLTSIQYRGNSNLYTTGAFRLMQQQLNPGGIGSAWVPITGITPEALKVIIRTFKSVFEHTSVWYMVNLPTDFVILIGTEQPLDYPLDNIEQRMQIPLVQRDLATIGMNDPYKLAACLLLAGDDVDTYVGTGPVHTDYRPLLDYLTHASPYHNTLPENLSEMLSLRTDPEPYISDWPADTAAAQQRWAPWLAASNHLIQGHIELHRQDDDHFKRAKAQYQAAHELIPDDERTKALLDEMD
jgi:spermidine synthase